jgi:hypothetical protein
MTRHIGGTQNIGCDLTAGVEGCQTDTDAHLK